MASKAAKLYIAEQILFRYRGAMAAMHARAIQYNSSKNVGLLYHGLDFPRKAKSMILKLAEKNTDIDIAECLELDGRATYNEIMTDIDNVITQSNDIKDKIEAKELISHDSVSEAVIAVAEDIFGRAVINEELINEEKSKYLLKVDPDNESEVLQKIAEKNFSKAK